MAATVRTLSSTRMPGDNGFDVVARLTENLGEDGLPLVVFVTAWDDQAVRAFPTVGSGSE